MAEEAKVSLPLSVHISLLGLTHTAPLLLACPCFFEGKNKVLILFPGPSCQGHLGSQPWPQSQRLLTSLLTPGGR